MVFDLVRVVPVPSAPKQKQPSIERNNFTLHLLVITIENKTKTAHVR